MDDREREQAARAIARDARSKRDAAAQRLNVTVGSVAVAVMALVWLRSGLSSSAFGLGILVGIALGVVVGVAIGQRHSSRKTP